MNFKSLELAQDYAGKLHNPCMIIEWAMGYELIEVNTPELMDIYLRGIEEDEEWGE